MPQDTIRTGNGQADYIVLPVDNDTFPKDVREQLHQIAQDQGFEKKPGSDEWIPILSVIGIFVLAWIIIRIRDGKNKTYVALGSMVNNETDFDIVENDGTIIEEPEPDYLVYEGNELNLSEAEITAILNKRSIYFIKLSQPDKEKFLYRLHEFIKQKTFFIHDKSGYKEMPVLISAAAIQLSFGLSKYLLPDFPNIHIFPEEFIKTEPTIRFLEGNVSDNCINISWKHFLHGFNSPADGQNVGLHELAHAYYFQNFETGNNIDSDFVTDYPKFNNTGNKVFEQEQVPGYDFYSDYALRNFQEFWAESVEKFFERPFDMKAAYPELYEAICELLNQDPTTVNT